MSAVKGKQFIMKVGDGTSPPTYNLIGGLRSNSFTINNENVDITDKDSSGWRLMQPAGITSMQLAGSGIFKDSQAERDLLSASLSGAIVEMQLVCPQMGTFTGRFCISSMQESGEYNGMVNYNITLDNADAIAFVAE